MTVTINKMSAGKGYEYLLRTVAAGDGDRSLSTPLTRYYTEAGTPPGRWMGSGLPALESAITAGEEVTEDQLKRLIGEGSHPATGEPLGRRYRSYSQPEAGKRRQAVAGYDLTFSIPKSASVLWGVADGGTQALIAEAHHAAVADALDFLEREIVATRVGAKGPKGAVAQVEVTGVVAAAFDHYDSRANDPHLHTHVVISNKVRTVRDGQWRTIDGAPLHAWVVALSELHEASFSDHLTLTLGVGWERRPRGRDRNPAWEIIGVPQSLVEKFSSRSRDIDAATDQLIEEYVARHGRRPRRATIMKLRQQANLSTRPSKRVHSLAHLADLWRRRTAEHLGVDPVMWARRMMSDQAGRLLRADDIPLDVIEDFGSRVVASRTLGRNRMVRANMAHPAASALTQLLEVTFGPKAVIADEFAMSGAEQVLIFGSWASRYAGQAGPPPHDIDVLVVGKVDRADLYAAADRAHARPGIEVNPVVRTAKQWSDQSDALVSQVKESAFTVVLDAHELAGA